MHAGRHIQRLSVKEKADLGALRGRLPFIRVPLKQIAKGASLLPDGIIKESVNARRPVHTDGIDLTDITLPADITPPKDTADLTDITLKDITDLTDITPKDTADLTDITLLSQRGCRRSQHQGARRHSKSQPQPHLHTLVAHANTTASWHRT